MAVIRALKTEKGFIKSYKRVIKVENKILVSNKSILRVNTPQLVNKDTIFPTLTRNGVTFTNNGDGTITINGTASADMFEVFLTINNLPQNYKVLVRGCPKGGTTTTYFIGTNQGPRDLGEGVIIDLSSRKNYINFYIMIKNGFTADNLIFRPQVINITQAFGEGNEPATAEEAEAILGKDYIPYQYI